MAETSQLYLVDSVADDLEKPPEDLRQVLVGMSSKEATISSTTRMVEGLLRDGFVKLVLEMLTSGVEPNAYTYAVIIKALAAAHDLRKNPNFVVYAENYLVEMLDRGMQPNEETYEAVLEGIGRGENKTEVVEEHREFVENVKAKGFVLVLQKEAEEMVKPPPEPEMEMLEEPVMKVFADATKDCEDPEARFRFRNAAQSYDSLSQSALLLFRVLSSCGLNKEATELFRPLFDGAILPDEAVFTIVIH